MASRRCLSFSRLLGTIAREWISATLTEGIHSHLAIRSATKHPAASNTSRIATKHTCTHNNAAARDCSSMHLTAQQPHREPSSRLRRTAQHRKPTRKHFFAQPSKHRRAQSTWWHFARCSESGEFSSGLFISGQCKLQTNPLKLDTAAIQEHQADQVVCSALSLYSLRWSYVC